MGVAGEPGDKQLLSFQREKERGPDLNQLVQNV